MNNLQEGIYYSKRRAPSSFGIVFLRARDGADASKIGATISSLWRMYENLKKGVLSDLPSNVRHYSGDLSVLIGYSWNCFQISDIRRQRPEGFPANLLFRTPNKNGGGTILDGSGIEYSGDLTENHAESDHVVVQFISKSQLATNRAILETCKLLNKFKGGRKYHDLAVTKFYTGFNRPDGRNWLNFHDGVSNMNSRERALAITISGNGLNPADQWIINGTYLAFLRIAIDLEVWGTLDRRKQEIIIGRDKPTGCPLVGLDDDGNPIKDPRCPILGTLEVTDKGNEGFRQHPDFGRQINLPQGISDSILADSHIGRARRIVGLAPWDPQSSRIFRQSFEFLEPLDRFPHYQAGLNFVSFLNTPWRIYNILSNWFSNANLVGGSENPLQKILNILRIHAAGIFLVPPSSSEELFPGSSIFSDQLSTTSQIMQEKINDQYPTNNPWS